MRIYGIVESLAIRDKTTRAPRESRAFLEVSLEGIVGDVHFGFSRAADARDKAIKRGTRVRNWRQWSAVSSEELDVIAQRMGLENLDPNLLSANFTISGIPNFTLLPRGTELRFPEDAILMVEDENAPCIRPPGNEIANVYAEIKPQEFVKAAMHLRGLVGVVYRAGFIRAGDKVQIDVYEPKSYRARGN